MLRVSVLIVACLSLLGGCKKKADVVVTPARPSRPDTPALPAGPISGNTGGCMRTTTPLDGGVPAKGCGETELTHATVPDVMTAKMAHKERCENRDPPGVFVDEGCPDEGRIGGCSLPYKTSGTFTHWYYSGVTREEIQLLCTQQNRTFVEP